MDGLTCKTTILYMGPVAEAYALSSELLTPQIATEFSTVQVNLLQWSRNEKYIRGAELRMMS